MQAAVIYRDATSERVVEAAAGASTVDHSLWT